MRTGDNCTQNSARKKYFSIKSETTSQSVFPSCICSRTKKITNVTINIWEKIIYLASGTYIFERKENNKTIVSPILPDIFFHTQLNTICCKNRAGRESIVWSHTFFDTFFPQTVLLELVLLLLLCPHEIKRFSGNLW